MRSKTTHPDQKGIFLFISGSPKSCNIPSTCFRVKKSLNARSQNHSVGIYHRCDPSVICQISAIDPTNQNHCRLFPQNQGRNNPENRSRITPFDIHCKRKEAGFPNLFSFQLNKPWPDYISVIPYLKVSLANTPP